MLNELQQKAFDAVLKSDESVVVLTGSGGTGKSYTTAEIIKSAASVAITATTHAAKDVLAAMTETKTSTTQSAMGFVMVKINYQMVLAQRSSSVSTGLLVVDETSMLPFGVYESIMKAVDEGAIQKVLFLGDPVQLPSIGKGVDIEEIPGLHIELMEQMRQDAGDLTTRTYLEELRASIQYGDKAPSLNELENIHMYTDHKAFCDMYKTTHTAKKVVAYRNRVVDKYNEYIHDGKNHFNEGDVVIINKPISSNNMIIANNSDQVVVQSATEDTEFPRWILRVMTVSGNAAILHHWTSQVALTNYLEKLKRDNQVEKYWQVHNQAQSLKHVYACTIFKIQGGSIPTVFIDATDLWAAHTSKPNKYNNPISYDMFLRLLYVAVSRMTKKCHLFVGDIRNYNYLKD